VTGAIDDRLGEGARRGKREILGEILDPPGRGRLSVRDGGD
jgi:hypothetical protein